MTVQCEDEIPVVASAVGASFAGALAVTLHLRTGYLPRNREAMNLDCHHGTAAGGARVQRGGPATGLPTKSEQTDLLQVLFGP